jgi:hypothetical protein
MEKMQKKHSTAKDRGQLQAKQVQFEEYVSCDNQVITIDMQTTE